MLVECVAVVGAKNNLLYLSTSEPDPDLRFHYLAHSSLDVIEEKVTSVQQVANKAAEAYLGPLFVSGDHKVYGYITNTKVKFIIAVENAPLQETDLRKTFKEIHDQYIFSVSSPFYKPGSEISSLKFDKAMKALLGGKSKS